MSTGHEEARAGVTEASDLQLITRTRAGDPDAYATLFARHHALALRVATGIGGADLADDLVAEAFVRILALLKAGKGPQRTFGAYLKVTLRSVYVDHVRRDARLELHGDAADLPDVAMVDPTDERVEASLVTKAFSSLGSRAQTVLWLSEVDDVPPAEIAELLDLTPNAVAQLAFRARESLRQGYLAGHLGAVVRPECQEVADFLPAYVRGSQTPRRTARVEQHVADCVRCALALAELQALESQLRAFLLPLLPPAALGIGVSGGARSGDPLPAAPPAAPVGRFGRFRPSQGVVAASVVGLGCTVFASFLLRAVDNEAAVAADAVPVVVAPDGSQTTFPTAAPPTESTPGEPSASDSAAPSESPSESLSESPTESPSVSESPSASPTATPTSTTPSPTSAPTRSSRPEPSVSETPSGSATPTEGDPEPTTSSPRPEPPVGNPRVASGGAQPTATGGYSAGFRFADVPVGATVHLIARGPDVAITSVVGSGWSCTVAQGTTVACEATTAGGSSLTVGVRAPEGGDLRATLSAPGDPDLSNNAATAQLTPPRQ